MRYSPEQIERLAGEFVLGTLHGSARRRMEALMCDRYDVRLAIWQWERALGGLTQALEPVRPPRSVWQAIDRRVAGKPATRAPKTNWWPKLALAGFAAAILAFWAGTALPPVIQAERLAVFTDDASRALWVIETDVDTRQLIAQTSGVPAAADNLVYELWALPAGESPVSLGVLETAPGRYTRDIGSDRVAAIGTSANFAISLEPQGCSPTGLPTGPIVYQASVVRL